MMVLMLCTFALSARAHGQPGVLVPGVHFGAPLRASILLAVAPGLGTPTGGERKTRTVFAGVEPGLGGWRASVGFMAVREWADFNLGGHSVRASVLRTNSRPSHAPANTTMVGGEYQFIPNLFGIRVGVFSRVSKGDGPRTRGTVDLSFAL
jgi:hypothetical protein